MTSPFFSIVVATRNASGTIPRCLESLAVQEWRDFEVVLQDAVSADTTLELAQAFRPRLPQLLMASEPDTGIYDAWNKALDRITGQWVLFLGADDALEHAGALGQAAELLARQSNAIQYLATPVLLTSPVGEVIDKFEPSTTPWRDIQIRMPFPHMGLFHHSSLFWGRYFNDCLRIAGDYDFLCRTLTLNNFVFCEEPLVRMALGGISSNMDTMLARELECLKVVRQHFSGHVACRIYLRIVRAAVYKVVASIFSRRAGLLFDDAITRLQGRPVKWIREG